MKLTKSQVVSMAGVALAVAAPFSFAADDVDYSAMLAGVTSAGAVSAIVAMGVIKLAPNFAKWAVNKVASFF